MPKWKSAIFSDIRNAIGDNVVFSIWKGRPYFRSFVTPANPRTNPQQAHRAVLTQLVKRYQQLMANPAVKTQWNEEALAYLMSGFNIFLRWGRLSELSAAPASGSAPLSVTITYKCGIPLAKARLYQLKDGLWSDVTPLAGLQAQGQVVLNNLTAGTYTFFLADADVLVPEDDAPQAYQAITKWKPDETNGTSKEAKVIVS